MLEVALERDAVDGAGQHRGLERAVAALAAGLRGVHGEVGRAHELVRVAQLAARDGDADAGAEVDLAVGHRDRLRERQQDPLGDAGRVVAVRQVFDHHRELVAAEARDGVGGPQHAVQAPADLDEHLVAAGVAEAVVDRLEVVEVEDQDSEHPVALAARERVPDAVEQQRAVGQPGERVVERAVAELAVAGAQRVGHGVERVGDLVELRERVELDAVVEVTAAELARRAAQRAQRPPDRAGEAARDQQRDRQCGDQRGEDGEQLIALLGAPADLRGVRAGHGLAGQVGGGGAHLLERALEPLQALRRGERPCGERLQVVEVAVQRGIVDRQHVGVGARERAAHARPGRPALAAGPPKHGVLGGVDRRLQLRDAAEAHGDGATLVIGLVELALLPGGADGRRDEGWGEHQRQGQEQPRRQAARARNSEAH